MRRHIKCILGVSFPIHPIHNDPAYKTQCTFINWPQGFSQKSLQTLKPDFWLSQKHWWLLWMQLLLRVRHPVFMGKVETKNAGVQKGDYQRCRQSESLLFSVCSLREIQKFLLKRSAGTSEAFVLIFLWAFGKSLGVFHDIKTSGKPFSP